MIRTYAPTAAHLRAIALAASLTPSRVHSLPTAVLMSHLVTLTDAPVLDPKSAGDVGVARARVLGEIERRAKRCLTCGRPRLLDAFSGEGGAGVGYQRAGFCVDAVDTSAARLKRYPLDCPAARTIQGDAVAFIAEHGHEYAAGHGSPTCTGYSRGTAAIPDRLTRYDRLIAATREAFLIAGIEYVIENVADARPELRAPVLLCGRQFGLAATDADGTPLVMDRHRLFETSFPVMALEHPKHDRSVQVAGSYGGARRDKREAREVRKGGYVPSADVQRELLGTPWMSEKGCQLSIPPAFTKFIGRQLLAHLETEQAA